jgi:hypothetical protein
VCFSNSPYLGTPLFFFYCGSGTSAERGVCGSRRFADHGALLSAVLRKPVAGRGC